MAQYPINYDERYHANEGEYADDIPEAMPTPAQGKDNLITEQQRLIAYYQHENEALQIQVAFWREQVRRQVALRETILADKQATIAAMTQYIDILREQAQS